MQWETELCQRMLRVVPLSEKSIKYVKDSEDQQEELLVHRILLSVAKKVHEKREPVKLREIADDLYESVTKKEMDNVRQLLKKTLIPSNIVEKLNLGKKDIRFLPTAYRFQETKKVESSSGQSIREPVGPVIELPREYFPVPSGKCFCGGPDHQFGRNYPAHCRIVTYIHVQSPEQHTHGLGAKLKSMLTHAGQGRICD